MPRSRVNRFSTGYLFSQVYIAMISLFSSQGTRTKISDNSVFVRCVWIVRIRLSYIRVREKEKKERNKERKKKAREKEKERKTNKQKNKQVEEQRRST